MLSDLAQQLVILCEKGGKPLHQLSASMRCRLDMRGCFNLFDKSAVQLQDNVIEIAAVSDNKEEEMQTFLSRAPQASACRQGFVNATPTSSERVA